eukprot:jgi/Psemu1/30393/gm1.30393_g
MKNLIVKSLKNLNVTEKSERIKPTCLIRLWKRMLSSKMKSKESKRPPEEDDDEDKEDADQLEEEDADRPEEDEDAD